ncbi:MAG: aquaporin [Actinomycetota bacterium]|jgi:aquaporin Z|nr:aquaporin [Candidatus Actinomarina sp.]MDA2947408.1 aquaporin [Actinomycetota bacterium]MDA3037883.1 aquaporin [Actinomycetota bacterium]
MSNLRFTANSKSLLAEALGTFALVFIGCGSVILSEVGNFNPKLIPYVFGLTITSCVYLLGKYSGAHFNPAVTIGFFINKEISVKDGILYISIQILSAISASLLHNIVFTEQHSFGTTTISTTYIPGSVAEILCTAFLMLVILLVTRNDNRVYGLAIGGAVTLSALLIGDMTGASLNPARSIGPMILYGNTIEIWFYILFPIVGSSIGTVLYNYLKNDSSG